MPHGFSFVFLRRDFTTRKRALFSRQTIWTVDEISVGSKMYFGDEAINNSLISSADERVKAGNTCVRYARLFYFQVGRRPRNSISGVCVLVYIYIMCNPGSRFGLSSLFRLAQMGLWFVLVACVCVSVYLSCLNLPCTHDDLLSGDVEQKLRIRRDSFLLELLFLHQVCNIPKEKQTIQRF